jgi:hypothetical protein
LKQRDPETAEMSAKFMKRAVHSRKNNDFNETDEGGDYDISNNDKVIEEWNITGKDVDITMIIFKL